MTSSTVPDALFTDALSGTDGTDDPPPPRWRPETFPDALVAPQLDTGPGDGSPAVTVPAAPVPSPENWVGDLDLPSPAPPARSNAARSSAARAEAARQAAAARRDAARAVSAGPGTRRSSAPSGARVAVAASTPAASLPAPAVYQQVAYPPGYQQPAYQASAYRQPSYAPPTAFAQQPTGARHPAPVAPAGRPAPHRPSPSRRPSTSGGSQRKKSSGLWGALVFLIFLLIASGFGQRILDALSDLINQ
jgi:hypothetical protein